MENVIRLSLGGDIQAAHDLQRWISSTTRGCDVRDVETAPQPGHKGIELIGELIVAVVNAPALLELARTIVAYLFARPEVNVELVHGDGRRVAVNAKNVSLDKVGEFAKQLSGAVIADTPSR